MPSCSYVCLSICPSVINLKIAFSFLSMPRDFFTWRLLVSVANYLSVYQHFIHFYFLSMLASFFLPFFAAYFVSTAQLGKGKKIVHFACQQIFNWSSLWLDQFLSFRFFPCTSFMRQVVRDKCGKIKEMRSPLLQMWLLNIARKV